MAAAAARIWRTTSKGSLVARRRSLPPGVRGGWRGPTRYAAGHLAMGRGIVARPLPPRLEFSRGPERCSCRRDRHTRRSPRCLHGLGHLAGPLEVIAGVEVGPAGFALIAAVPLSVFGALVSPRVTRWHLARWRQRQHAFRELAPEIRELRAVLVHEDDGVVDARDRILDLETRLRRLGISTLCPKTEVDYAKGGTEEIPGRQETAPIQVAGGCAEE